MITCRNVKKLDKEDVKTGMLTLEKPKKQLKYFSRDRKFDQIIITQPLKSIIKHLVKYSNQSLIQVEVLNQRQSF